MFSKKESQESLTSNLIVAGLLTLICIGPIALSGVIFLGVTLVLFAVVRIWLFSCSLGIVGASLLALVIYYIYLHSELSEIPVSSWSNHITFSLIEPFLGSMEYGAVTQKVIRYAEYTARFWPLGVFFWAGFGLHKKWHTHLLIKLKTAWLLLLGKRKERRSGPDVYMGNDPDTGLPMMISEAMRLRHTQVLGATGYGKTESVLLNFIHNDIQNGRGLFLLDGKADVNLRDQILTLAETYGRLGDVHYLNYSDEHLGETYNPLMNGSDTEIRDRIMDALNWSEEYYKKCASSALLLAVNAVSNEGPAVTLEKIVQFLMEPKKIKYTIQKHLQPLYKDFCDHHQKRLVEIKGLVTDLNNLILSGYGRNFNPAIPDIDLWNAIQNKAIVIFQVSTLDLGETARAFGRLVIQDLKGACGHINRKGNEDRSLFSVYIDEFESFAHESFNELISKSRSAGLGIHIFHQSMGDLEKIGDFFKKQITENTNNKIVLRVNDEETVEYFANMAGTKAAQRYTDQVEDHLFMKRKTGVGTVRQVEEFLIHPNVFRSLGIGEAVVMTRNNGRSNKVKLSRLPKLPKLRNYSQYLKDKAQQAVDATNNFTTMMHAKEKAEGASVASKELF